MKRVAFVLAAVLCAVSVSAQQPRPPRIFSGQNLTGSSAELFADTCSVFGTMSMCMKGPGFSVASVDPGISTNLTSAKIPTYLPNVMTIFEQPNFGGLCMSFDRPALALAATLWGPRQIQSYKVNQGGCSPQVVLYENIGYGGRAVTISGPTPELGLMNFNDAVSSVRLVNGATSVALYEHNNFQGNCLTLTADTTSLMPSFSMLVNWSDRVSSAIVNQRCP